MSKSTPILLQYGFRSFFLLAPLWAVLALLLWLALLGGHAIPTLANPLGWHAHEMLYGFLGAAIAGFLLTAVPSWTNQPPLSGQPLAILVAVWGIGRLAMLLAGVLPNLLVLVLDSAFLPLLAAQTIKQLRAANNKGQYPLLALLGLLTLANLAYHCAPWLGYSALTPLYLALHAVLGLAVLIGGRIIPSFTTNWMRAKGLQPLPVSSTWLEVTAAILTLLVLLGDSLAPAQIWVAPLAFAAAIAHGLRLYGWRGWLTLREGLLVILHIGYGWLVLGYALLGMAALGWLPRSLGIHALAVGGMSILVIAVMSRASLGHTGRKLYADDPLLVAYGLVILGALLRLIAPFTGGYYLPMLTSAGVIWAAGFALYALRFWPILSQPTVKG